ncbi:hypothetical protein PL2TA16_02090 [Pseudoalteromonas luteoviolacea 2ta16]|uniref:Uncharacterized protein n=1 Tax=Pseudoalteromonas luteoviolacea (strain 2ta16) TaxID=1353533 RepID=V4HTT1_PSEL2|nr:hypothetical protein [Pseudoalteromonas luteoviolacea]ESP94245.1 hypothetical protein PL2TA16_02090 [Pseudoalteromonas luteoviolacea 2ta16]
MVKKLEFKWLLVVIISLNVNANMETNIDFYLPSFAKNYIPVMMTNSDEYSIAMLSNFELAKFVNTMFIKSKNTLGKGGFDAEYEVYIIKNLRSGYLHIDAERVIEFFGLVRHKKT